MRNRFFTPSMLDVLLSPQDWVLFGPDCPPPVLAVTDSAHREWMVENTHRHQHTEVMFVLEGRGRHGYRGEVYPFGPGTGFCFGPGEDHDEEVPEWGPDAQVLWVNLTQRGFAARLLSFRSDLPRSGGHLGHLLMAEDYGPIGFNPLTRLRYLEFAQPPVRPLILRAGIELLLAAIIGHGYEPDDRPGEESVQRRMIRMVTDHLHAIGGAATLDDCARLAGYSKSHFHRLFQLYTGQRVQDYINDCRLIRIGELEQRGWKKQDLAQHFGFSSAASFSRWYQREYKRRPF